MVYVFPNTLEIDPTDPYNTTRGVTVSAYIGIGWDVNFPCGAMIGYTKTNIHLLRRVADKGITWAKADHIATYDCSSQCCLNLNTASFIPNNPGNNFTGWRIEFPPLPTAMPVGSYEFMAIDDGDYKNIASVDVNRVATRRVEVQQDPDQIIVTPSPENGTTITECASGDYMCLYKDYIPYVIGVIILVLLLTSGKKK